MRIGSAERVSFGEARATIDKYVRALAKGDFRDAVRAAEACRTELMRRYQGRRVAVLVTLTDHIRREARLRQLAYAKARWSSADSGIAERYARAVVAGEFATVKLAAKTCYAELRRACSKCRTARPLEAVEMRIYELCRAMGLQRYARWTKAERTVLNRYLRALYAGRFPQLRLAANACAREMQRLFGRTGMQAEGDSSSAGRHSAEAVHHAMFDTANRLGLPRHKGALASLEQRLYEKYARATAEGRYVDALQAATACRREASRIYARIGALSPLHVRRLAPRSLAATQRGILKAVARLSVQYPGRRWLPAEMRIFGSWLRWYSRYHHVRRLQPLTQAANGLSDDLAKAGFRRTPRACESRLLIMRSKMMYA